MNPFPGDDELMVCAQGHAAFPVLSGVNRAGTGSYAARWQPNALTELGVITQAALVDKLDMQNSQILLYSDFN